MSYSYPGDDLNILSHNLEMCILYRVTRGCCRTVLPLECYIGTIRFAEFDDHLLFQSNFTHQDDSPDTMFMGL